MNRVSCGCVHSAATSAYLRGVGLLELRESQGLLLLVWESDPAQVWHQEGLVLMEALCEAARLPLSASLLVVRRSLQGLHTYEVVSQEG